MSYDPRRVIKHFSISTKIYFALVMFMVAVKVIFLLSPTAFPLADQESAFSWTAILAISVMGFIGLILARRTGFPEIWDTRISNRQRFLIPTLIGLVYGAIRVIQDLPDPAPVHLKLPLSILFYTYGALLLEITPKLLPEIVRLAHKARLYVSVHISTAKDFHNALIAGADEIAHLPFVDFVKELGNEHFLISETDARLAAKRGVRVITTLGWLVSDLGDKPQEAEKARTQVVIPNLRLLKRYRVKLLVGSDQFRQTSLPEILLISSLNVFTNLKLLKMSCEVTPQAIFPKRKIGFLRDGYEASFLVLDGNPLTNFQQIKNIRLRFKQGYRLNLVK